MAIYYRIEWDDRDVMTSPFRSTGWGENKTVKDGLSVCVSAAALVRYFQPWVETIEKMALCEPEEDHKNYAAWNADYAAIMERAHRIPTEYSRVVILSGEKIGTGIDGEPLIIPHAVIAGTTFGNLCDHPAIEWLNGADDDDIEAILEIEPKNSAEGEEYIIGGLCVRMTDEAAARWNDGNITEADEHQIFIHDANRDVYLTFAAASHIKLFRDMLEGAYAEKE